MNSSPPSPTPAIGILTKNESRLIGRCIEIAFFADEVIVLDSGSTDNTLNIAQKLAPKIFTTTARQQQRKLLWQTTLPTCPHVGALARRHHMEN